MQFISPAKGKDLSPKQGISGYDSIINYLVVRPLFWRCGECKVTFLLPLLLGTYLSEND